MQEKNKTIQITLKNTFSYLSENFLELPRPIINKIMKQLSYSKKVSLRAETEIYLINKTKNSDPNCRFIFPTGLLLKLYRLFKELGVSTTFKDLRGPKTPVRPLDEFFKRLNKIDPKMEEREYQRSAIEKCLKYGRGCIEHSTGAGKTFCIAGIIYCVNSKTLILCTGKEHVRQITGDMEKLVGCSVTVFGSGRFDTSGTIVIANVQALNALKKKDINKYKKLLEKFKCLMADEVHHLSGDSYKNVVYHCINAYWRFGFSGTMFREDGSFLEVIGGIGPVIDKKDYTYLQDKNHIVPARFLFLDPMCSILRGPDNYWPKCLSAGIVRNNKRNNFIARICDAYSKKGKKVLVISPFRTEHGAILSEIINDSKFLYGESNEYERENTLKAYKNSEFNVLISSTIFDEVINLPDVRCVILAGGGKAHNSFFQRVGRGIRKAEGKTHVDIVILWDSHSSVLLRHSKKIRAYINKIESWRDNVKTIGSIRQQYLG